MQTKCNFTATTYCLFPRKFKNYFNVLGCVVDIALQMPLNEYDVKDKDALREFVILKKERKSYLVVLELCVLSLLLLLFIWSAIFYFSLSVPKQQWNFSTQPNGMLIRSKSPKLFPIYIFSTLCYYLVQIFGV